MKSLREIDFHPGSSALSEPFFEVNVNGRHLSSIERMLRPADVVRRCIEQVSQV